PANRRSRRPTERIWRWAPRLVFVSDMFGFPFRGGYRQVLRGALAIPPRKLSVSVPEWTNVRRSARKHPGNPPKLRGNDPPESSKPRPPESRAQDARSTPPANVPAQGRSNRSGGRSSSGSAPQGASPARVCALAVARRVFEEDAYADRALHGEAERLGLSGR